jgi:hypothetical protein
VTLNLRPWTSKETKLKREWRDQYDEADDASGQVRGVSVRGSSDSSSYWNRPQAIAVYRYQSSIIMLSHDMGAFWTNH